MAGARPRPRAPDDGAHRTERNAPHGVHRVHLERSGAVGGLSGVMAWVRFRNATQASLHAEPAPLYGPAGTACFVVATKVQTVSPVERRNLRRRQARAELRPKVVTNAQGTRWALVEDGGVAQEVFAFDAAGEPIKCSVNTRIFCYRMTCTCGRIRHAQPNTVFQIDLCRVCAAESRRDRKRVKRQ